MGKAKSRKLRDLMRNVEYKREQEAKAKNQEIIDFIKTYSTIARKSEDYPVTEKVLELKKAQSIDEANYPDGLVIPEMWIWEFGLR